MLLRKVCAEKCNTAQYCCAHIDLNCCLSGELAVVSAMVARELFKDWRCSHCTCAPHKPVLNRIYDTLCQLNVILCWFQVVYVAVHLQMPLKHIA